MGLLSNDRRLHATGLVALHPPAGKLSFISQSGSIGPTVISTCERRGIGVEKFVSVGNEAMVSAFDVLDYLRDDPDTECVMMYLEGIDDGRHFLDAARRTTARKPVVVLRGGLTELGGKAAASHTGALAGSAAVFRAAARQAGVVTCGTTQELVDLGACLAYLPLPRGRRVAVITNGGGPGVLAADEVALNGLELAALPPELVAALDEILPPFWSRRNPLDLVAAGFGEVGLRALELVTRCETVDAVMALNFLGVPSTGDDAERSSRTGSSRASARGRRQFSGTGRRHSWKRRASRSSTSPIIPVHAGCRRSRAAMPRWSSRRRARPRGRWAGWPGMGVPARRRASDDAGDGIAW